VLPFNHGVRLRLRFRLRRVEDRGKRLKKKTSNTTMSSRGGVAVLQFRGFKALLTAKLQHQATAVLK
jgi:hypothetical protein